jgi:aminoglycoside 3-N-acetyltransferase
MSVTSIGNRADEISGGPHFEGLGYDSPWGRLHRANAKLIVYGGGFKDGMTFFHYIESMYRVPYQYTKLYDTPVYARGSVQPGLFTLTVRYLDFGIANDAGRFERVLVDSEHARVVHIRGTKISVVPAMSAFDLGIEALREDRYFFLKYPPVFRRGHIPFDGATGPMRESYDADPRTKLTPGGALNDRQTFRGIPWSDLF